MPYIISNICIYLSYASCFLCNYILPIHWDDKLEVCKLMNALSSSFLSPCDHYYFISQDYKQVVGGSELAIKALMVNGPGSKARKLGFLT